MAEKMIFDGTVDDMTSIIITSFYCRRAHIPVEKDDNSLLNLSLT